MRTRIGLPRYLPFDRIRRFVFNRIGIRECVGGRSGLVTYVAAGCILFYETPYKSVYIGEQTAAVVSDVYYESFGFMKYRQNIVEARGTYA